MSYNATRLSRQKQISTLHVFNDNVTEIVEGSQYRIRFQSDQVSLELDIRLPANFPESERPEIECVPPVNHPWVDRITGRVDSPGLKSFSPHSDLGRVVLAIRSELEKSHVQPVLSPRQQTSQQQQMTANTSSITGSGGGRPGSSSYSVSAAPNPQLPFPTQATVLSHPLANPIRSKLDQLPVEDLKEIYNCEDGFEKFMHDFKYEQLEVVDDYLTELRGNVKNNCEENLKLQAEVEGKREELIRKCQNFHEIKEDVTNRYERLKEAQQKLSPSVLTERLVRLSVSHEEESEDIAENFLNNELSVDEFLVKYISSRQSSHIKKLKADRLKRSQAS